MKTQLIPKSLLLIAVLLASFSVSEAGNATRLQINSKKTIEAKLKSGGTQLGVTLSGTPLNRDKQVKQTGTQLGEK